MDKDEAQGLWEFKQAGGIMNFGTTIESIEKVETSALPVEPKTETEITPTMEGSLKLGPIARTD